MKQITKIKEYIKEVPEKELIFARELFQRIASKTAISEENFYKVLERMVSNQELARLSKGVYTRPQQTRFGLVLPTEKEIVDQFIENEKGMVVGYQLFNQLQLTSQISKRYHILTNNSHQKSTIQNISIKQSKLTFTHSVRETLAMLEVLSVVDNLQDLDEKQFITYCEDFAKNSYQDHVLDLILSEHRYKKSTLYFLKLILDSYHIPNTVHQYLSTLSKYKEPKVAYYEVA